MILSLAQAYTYPAMCLYDCGVKLSLVRGPLAVRQVWPDTIWCYEQMSVPLQICCGFLLFYALRGLISILFYFHDTGDAQIGPQVTPLDPTTVASEVYYGTQSGNYTGFATGTALIYNQIYPYQGLLNYTSGIIHHVRLEGWSLSLS